MGEAFLVQKNAVIKTPDPTVNLTSINFTSINVRLTNNHDKTVTMYYELDNALPNANTITVGANSFEDITLSSLSSNTAFTLYVYAKEDGQVPSDTLDAQFTTLTYTTQAPSINITNTETDEVTFTLTNNDTSTVTMYYEVNDSTPDITATVSGGATITRTIGSLTEGTNYTLYARAQASNENMSSTVSTNFSTTASIGLSASSPASSANELRDLGYPSGVYWINWGGTAKQIYCEMDLEGGGWMMILNYVHGAGTNPSLTVRTNDFPLMGPNEYSFGNESSSTGAGGSWGHISNSLANQYSWNEYMFYARSSGHGRIIHFRGNDGDIVNYIKTGSGSMVPHYADTSTNFNGSLRVNASIPLFINNDRSGWDNEGDYALTAFPIYGESTIGNPRAHWGIKGAGGRWEVDDYEGDGDKNTIHRVWVRAGGTLEPVLPVTSGLYARWVANDFSNGTWADSSGNNRNATVSKGSITKTTNSVSNGVNKSFTILRGSRSSGITFVDLPSSYTLFHVTRYTDSGHTDRIFTGSGGNWLSGFWSDNSAWVGSGVAFHGSWLTQNDNGIHGRDWVLSTDQNNLYRSNGVQRGTTSGGNHPTMVINGGNYSPNEDSDFEVAEVILYNRTLSSSEYQQVEQYLRNKYGFTY